MKKKLIVLADAAMSLAGCSAELRGSLEVQGKIFFPDFDPSLKFNFFERTKGRVTDESTGKSADFQYTLHGDALPISVNGGKTDEASRAMANAFIKTSIMF
jgi:hypothetical protein